MNRKTLITSVALGALVLAGCTQGATPTENSADNDVDSPPSSQAQQDAQATIEVTDSATQEAAEDAMIEAEAAIDDAITEADEAMEAADELLEDASSDDVETVAATTPMYQVSTPALLAAAQGKPHVVFFHAEWCPTCRVLESDIKKDLASFPSGTNILRANYDTDDELKAQYDIKIQSTVVVLDANGNVVLKAQDPALDDLKSAIEQSMSA